MTNMINTLKKSKILTDVMRYLGNDDKINGSFEIEFKNTDAYLMLTDYKIVVVEEIGLLRKSTKVLQDILYQSIRKVYADGNHKVTISIHNNIKYTYLIKTPDAPLIEDMIKYLMKNKKSILTK